MKITHGNQTIDLFAENIPKVCLISLSGGADSASLFYLISKYFPQVQLIPYTCKDENAHKDAEAAVKIISWMQEQFPNNNIQNTQIFNFNDRTEDYVTYRQCDLVIRSYPQFSGMRRTQISKIIQIDNISRNLMKNLAGAVRIDGMTRNPPKKIMKRLNFYHKAERRRDQELPKVIEYRTKVDDPASAIYQPYANVDKKFVAGVYKDNNLMETLFPLTRSCVGTARQTDNFTRECHQCFWCYEKKWAFDLEWND